MNTSENWSIMLVEFHPASGWSSWAVGMYIARPCVLNGLLSIFMNCGIHKCNPVYAFILNTCRQFTNNALNRFISTRQGWNCTHICLLVHWGIIAHHGELFPPSLIMPLLKSLDCKSLGDWKANFCLNVFHNLSSVMINKVEHHWHAVTGCDIT